jgi:hypothetical protein
LGITILYHFPVGAVKNYYKLSGVTNLSCDISGDQMSKAVGSIALLLESLENNLSACFFLPLEASQAHYS